MYIDKTKLLRVAHRFKTFTGMWDNFTKGYPRIVTLITVCKAKSITRTNLGLCYRIAVIVYVPINVSEPQ